MSIRISKGGRLFEIVAALGGAVMIGGAARTWTKAVRVTYFLPYEISELNGAERIATLVLGLLVIAGAACFIALGSRRVRIAAGGVVVLAAAAGLVIAMLADPPPFAGSPLERPCQLDLRLPCTQTLGGDGRVLAGWGAVLAAGYGIMALLRAGGEASPTPAVRRSPAVPSASSPPNDFDAPPKRRMSDASLLAWTMVAIVIAVVVGFFVVIWSICSDPTEWC
jgi:hypothetical protein